MNNKEGTFQFLGTGGSHGIPVVGCNCAVCTSSSPFNQRFRTSGLITVKGKTILIDAGPDFRSQALRYNIKHLDGVIITHAHYDHIGGMDDLRIFYLIAKNELPCMLSKASFNEIQKRYDYFFKPTNAYANLSARFDFQLLPNDRGEVDFLGIAFKYMTYVQGGMKVNGIRIGNFAYISDIKEYPETVFDDLKGVDTLVLSALRMSSSHVHFNLEEAIEFSKKVGASKTWLTHMAHDLNHEEANCYLPERIRLAYDGLIINLF